MRNLTGETVPTDSELESLRGRARQRCAHVLVIVSGLRTVRGKDGHLPHRSQQGADGGDRRRQLVAFEPADGGLSGPRPEGELELGDAMSSSSSADELSRGKHLWNISDPQYTLQGIRGGREVRREAPPRRGFSLAGR